jgi:DNA-binding protein H-NS
MTTLNNGILEDAPSEPKRTAFRKYLGRYIGVRGDLSAVDQNRPAAAIENVRLGGDEDEDLTDHTWVQVREQDWWRWKGLRVGEAVSVRAKVVRYKKHNGKPEFGLKDGVLELATAPLPKNSEAVKHMTKDDIKAALPTLTRPDLEEIQSMVAEEISRQRRSDLDALREQMHELRELAHQSGFDWAEVIGNVAEESKPTPAPKYRNPDNPEETWSGRGHRPRWLKAQLVAGRELEEFAVNLNGKE